MAEDEKKNIPVGPPMSLGQEEMLIAILDSIPYQIVFIDENYIVRFMNREARYQNYDVLGYDDIMNHCIFDCHKNPKSSEMIKKMAEGFKHNAPEQFGFLTDDNQRLYYTPVRDKNGKYIGMYERREMNLEYQRKL